MLYKITYTLVFVLAFFYSSYSQVINKEYLQKDHSGILANAKSNSGKALNHNWLFQSIDGVKSYYKLRLTAGKKTKEYDVHIRNLITTTYIAVRLTDKAGKVTTLTSVYDKGDKWQRVKMAPKQECLRENAKWKRYNQIKSLQELLDNIVAQIDENLVLQCYMQS